MPTIIHAKYNMNDTWSIEYNGLLYVCDAKDFIELLWHLVIKAYFNA